MMLCLVCSQSFRNYGTVFFRWVLDKLAAELIVQSTDEISFIPREKPRQSGR